MTNAIPAGAPSRAFLAAFDLTIGQEGGFTNAYGDKGNWTGGAIGSGRLSGTNWGICAASYPTLNIKALTKADAQAIYLRDYWTVLRCDELAPALAGLVFDAAVNNGQSRAAIFLQAAAAVATDGQLGPQTMAAIAKASTADLPALLCEFQARRIDFDGNLPTFKAYGLGWSRRFCSTLAWALAQAAQAVPG